MLLSELAEQRALHRASAGPQPQDAPPASPQALTLTSYIFRRRLRVEFSLSSPLRRFLMSSYAVMRAKWDAEHISPDRSVLGLSSQSSSGPKASGVRMLMSSSNMESMAQCEFCLGDPVRWGGGGSSPTALPGPPSSKEGTAAACHPTMNGNRGVPAACRAPASWSWGGSEHPGGGGRGGPTVVTFPTPPKELSARNRGRRRRLPPRDARELLPTLPHTHGAELPYIPARGWRTCARGSPRPGLIRELRPHK